MIHPEFEDAEGNIILDNNRSVQRKGNAKMWIVVPQMRPYHYDKIKVGLKGYFMEGANKVAECEVIEVLGLKTNPISHTSNTKPNT